jgi:hypothetical protein
MFSSYICSNSAMCDRAMIRERGICADLNLSSAERHSPTYFQDTETFQDTESNITSKCSFCAPVASVFYKMFRNIVLLAVLLLAPFSAGEDITFPNGEEISIHNSEPVPGYVSFADYVAGTKLGVSHVFPVVVT